MTHQKPYTEGPDSTFTHMGEEYSVDCLLQQTRRLSVQLCPISELEWILEYGTPDEERVLKADTSVPIIVLRQNGKDTRPVVLDGFHRLVRAIRDGDKNILSKVVRNYHIQNCKLGPSKK